jgi:HEAT repeat protein
MASGCAVTTRLVWVLSLLVALAVAPTRALAQEKPGGPDKPAEKPGDDKGDKGDDKGDKGADNGGDMSGRKLDDDAAFELAGRIADSDDEADAAKALEELRRMGDQGIWDLLEAAKDAEDEDIDTLAEAIAMLGRDAVPELVRTLNEEDDDVLTCTLEALAAVGKDALPHLVKAVKDVPDEGRFRAAALLVKLAPDCITPLVGYVRNGPAEARLAATAALGMLGEPAVKPLLAAIPSSKPAGVAGTAALLQIGSGSPDLAKAIEKAAEPWLKSKNADLRGSGVRLVARFGGADAMPVVIDALTSDDEGIRKSAAECAAAIGEPAVPDLIHCLNAEDEKVVDAAVDALSDIGDPAVPSLRKMLKAPIDQVKGSACAALGNMKNKPSVPFIIPLLDDPSPTIKDDAREALESIAGEKLENKDAWLAWWEKHKDDEDAKDGPKKEPPAPDKKDEAKPAPDSEKKDPGGE